MRMILAAGLALAIATGSLFAQTATAVEAADTTKPAAEPEERPPSLKLPSVHGDTFDLAGLEQPLVVLVAGTDSTSRAAAEAVQKAYAAAIEPALYFAVLEASMKKAKATADEWQLGYIVLADSGRKMMQWLSSNVPAKLLSPKARPPLGVFMDATGKVTKVETSVTEAGVIEGVKAMSKSKETMVDPVCKMTISKKTAAATYEYEGKTYYFCSGACKDNFVKDPQKYLSK